MDQLGGRKFALAILALLSASVLAWFGKINPDAYAYVVIALAGAYTAGNVAQKAIAPKSDP